MDADVRAGPWPSDDAKPGEPRSISVHIYVDHSIVSLIVGNQTAITAWVHPSQPDSVGVALFSDRGDVEATSIAIWQLASAASASEADLSIIVFALTLAGIIAGIVACWAVRAH